MTLVDPVEKLRRIFHVAPWLKTDGKAVHIPVSGMDDHHQLTWPELYELFRRLNGEVRPTGGKS